MLELVVELFQGFGRAEVVSDLDELDPQLAVRHPVSVKAACSLHDGLRWVVGFQIRRLDISGY